MRNSVKIGILVLVAAGCCALYLFHDLNGSFDYALPKGLLKYRR